MITNNVILFAVIGATVIVLIGLFVFILQRFTIKEIAGQAGYVTLQTLQATNKDQALLDSIEANKTSIPRDSFVFFANMSTTAIQLALLVDPNSPSAAQAQKIIAEINRFRDNITDGVTPTIPTVNS